jgi:hypothetical protein
MKLWIVICFVVMLSAVSKACDLCEEQAKEMDKCIKVEQKYRYMRLNREVIMEGRLMETQMKQDRKLWKYNRYGYRYGYSYNVSFRMIP